MKITLMLVLLSVIGCVGTARAAETIRYEEIPNRLGHLGTVLGGFSVKVTTLDGLKHTGRKLSLQADGVLITSSDLFGPGQSINIPNKEVARIEIRRGKHAFDFTKGSAVLAAGPPVFCFAGGGDLWCLGIAILSPPAIGLAVASAPITLAVDAVERLLPAKVYEIVH